MVNGQGKVKNKTSHIKIFAKRCDTVRKNSFFLKVVRKYRKIFYFSYSFYLQSFKPPHSSKSVVLKNIKVVRKYVKNCVAKILVFPLLSKSRFFSCKQRNRSLETEINNFIN